MAAATTDVDAPYLHDALPILDHVPGLLTSTIAAIVSPRKTSSETRRSENVGDVAIGIRKIYCRAGAGATSSRGPSPNSSGLDRKSTRLNSSHSSISYAVYCLI